MAHHIQYIKFDDYANDLDMWQLLVEIIALVYGVDIALFFFSFLLKVVEIIHNIPDFFNLAKSR